MRPSILFVDDEPNILSGLRRLTRPRLADWDLDFAQSGEEALEKLAVNPVHLLVSDMRMPGMDGAHLMERVSQSNPGIIRFALSGESDIALAIRIAGKSHRFLAKPIDPEALIAAIDGLFSKGGSFLEQHRVLNASTFDGLKSASGRLDMLADLLTQPERNGLPVTAQIMADPSLSVRVLQLANSAYFGRPLQTLSVSRAINYVGLSRLAQLVERNRLGSAYEPNAPEDDHLLRAAAAVEARGLAGKAGASEDTQDLAYATALFSGLGANAVGSGTTCASRPSCIATLFGLPDRLAQSLAAYSASEETAQSASEIAARAARTALDTVDTRKEAA